MSSSHTPRFRCQAIMEQNTPCGRPCWGKTAYCRWHNASLFWQLLEMGARGYNQVGSYISRPHFDPEFVQNWKTAAWATNRRFFILWLIILVGGGIFSLIPTFSLGNIIFVLWAIGFLCIWWMENGNKSLLLPKLLVAVIVVTTVVQYLALITSSRVMNMKSISEFAYLVGFFLIAVPILPGPLVLQSADITDREASPPLIIGDVFLKILGFLLVFLSIFSLFLK